MNARLVGIPPELCSSDTGAPFARCLVCDRPLDGDTEYMVEKAFRRYPDYGLRDTVFEYAVCTECYAEISGRFSAESRARVDTYFAERVDQEERVKRLEAEAADNIAPWIGRCMVSGAPVDELEEYQVVAHCIGGFLVLGPAPFIIGGPVIDEIVELLSNETLDELGGFRDQYFGLPPELRPQVVVL